MAGKVLEIALMGNPILAQKARLVMDVFSPETKTALEDMQATIDNMRCTGLAATQVGILLRIFMFHIPVTKPTHPLYKLTPEYDPEGVPWTTLINPVITSLSDEMIEGWEACLSLPTLTGKVSRHKSIEYTYLTPEGKQQTRVAHGFHAVVVQHECDHLDGILYPERMTDLRTLGYREEVIQRMTNQGTCI